MAAADQPRDGPASPGRGVEDPFCRLEADVRELQQDFQTTLQSMQAGLAQLLQQRASAQQGRAQKLPRASATLPDSLSRDGSLSEQQVVEAVQQAGQAACGPAEGKAMAAAPAVARLDPLLQQALLDFKLPLGRLLELQSCGLLEGGSGGAAAGAGLPAQPQMLLAVGGPVAEATQAAGGDVEQQAAAAGSGAQAQAQVQVQVQGGASGPARELWRSITHPARRSGEAAQRSRSRGTSGLGRSKTTLGSSSAASSGWDSRGGSSAASSSSEAEASDTSDYFDDELEGSGDEGQGEGGVQQPAEGQPATTHKLQQARSQRQLALHSREHAPWSTRAKDWFLAAFWDVLRPTCRFRMRWDLFMLALLAYVCITAPYISCFDLEFAHDSGMGVWEIIVNAAFVADIYLNFRTGYYDAHHRLVMDRAAISSAYLRGWFLVDLVSSIPFSELLTSPSFGFVQLFKATRMMRLARIMRLLKMVRMLRIFKLGVAIRRLETLMGRGMLRVLFFVCLATLILHLTACFFYFIAMQHDNFENTWVQAAGLEEASNSDKYITAAYWAMSTLATVGYGDVHPSSVDEKIYAMLGMVLGVTIFAYFMGSMANLLANLNSGNTYIAQRLQQVDDFMRQRKVPAAMAERVHNYYNYILRRQVSSEQSFIMDELSVPLRTELVLFMYRDALERVPFFQGKDPLFIADVVTHLKLQYFSPGDVVIRQGDPGNVMYFISAGKLEVRQYGEGAGAHGAAGAGRLQYKPHAFGEFGEERLDKQAAAAPAAYKFKVKESPIGHHHGHDHAGGDAAQQEQEEQQQQHPHKHHKHGGRKDLYKAWKYINGLGKDFRLLGYLSAGQYFGEYSCLLGEVRTATVVAADFCELYSLARHDLEAVIMKWPELAAEFDRLIDGYRRAGAAQKRPVQGEAEAEVEASSSSWSAMLYGKAGRTLASLRPFKYLQAKLRSRGTGAGAEEPSSRADSMASDELGGSGVGRPASAEAEASGELLAPSQGEGEPGEGEEGVSGDIAAGSAGLEPASGPSFSNDSSGGEGRLSAGAAAVVDFEREWSQLTQQ